MCRDKRQPQPQAGCHRFASIVHQDGSVGSLQASSEFKLGPWNVARNAGYVHEGCVEVHSMFFRRTTTTGLENAATQRETGKICVTEYAPRSTRSVSRAPFHEALRMRRFELTRKLTQNARDV